MTQAGVAMSMVTTSDSSRGLDNLRAWSARQDPASPSGSDGPPAYGDISAGRKVPNRSISARSGRLGTQSLRPILPVRPATADASHFDHARIARQAESASRTVHDRAQSPPASASTNLAAARLAHLNSSHHGKFRQRSPDSDSVTQVPEMPSIAEASLESDDRTVQTRVDSSSSEMDATLVSPTWLLNRSQSAIIEGTESIRSDPLRSSAGSTRMILKHHLL
jgi:hypothetical protein